MLYCTFVDNNKLSTSLFKINGACCDKNCFVEIYKLKGKNSKRKYQSIILHNSLQIQKILGEDYIFVHKKIKTNTLFTINALNVLIKEINNGVVSEDTKIVWENYENKMLISTNGELELVNLIKVQYKAVMENFY